MVMPRLTAMGAVVLLLVGNRAQAYYARLLGVTAASDDQRIEIVEARTFVAR